MENRYWRLSRDEYDTMRDSILEKHKTETVDDWANLSMDPDLSDTERMARIMMDNDPNYEGVNYICQSYMSGCPLSQEFVEDCLYVNSGLCMIGCWDQEIIDWVLDLYKNYIPKSSKSSQNVNVFNIVLDAIESKKFIKINREYHNYLINLVTKTHYYEYANQLMNFKFRNTSSYKERIKDANEIREILFNIDNCRIYIKNKLDWDSIDTSEYDKKFVNDFYRSNKSPEDSFASMKKSSYKKKGSINYEEY